MARFRGSIGRNSKASFKHQEMQHELGHEEDDFRTGRFVNRRINRNPRPKTQTVQSKLDAHKLYLTVPYNDKEKAKESLKAKWDAGKKQWYVKFGSGWKKEGVISKIAEYHPDWVKEYL